MASLLTRGGLTRRTVLASGLLALLIGGVFTMLVVTSYDQRDARRLSRHSRAELAQAEALLKLIVDAETGTRGFVITRAEHFLEPWREARGTFAVNARALADFVDDPAQARLARRIAQDGTSYIDDYTVPLLDAVRRSEPSTRSVAVTEEGKQRVDALRAELARFTGSEAAAVNGFQKRVDDAAQRGLVVATGGLGLSLVLIALFGTYVARALVMPVRRAAAMAGRLAGGDLTVRMPETGTAEIGQLERSFNTMGRSLETSRDELRQLASDQAALRRVATLVARGVPPVEIWDAVVAEVDQLLAADSAALIRLGPDGAATVLASRNRTGGEIPVGMTYAPQDGSIVAMVLRSGRAARLDNADRGQASSPAFAEFELGSGVGAPIVVESRVWGMIGAGWTQPEAPPEAEGRVAEFTELVATAIANAASRDELTASRARVVATADETRRRIERDLHDGAQQRLVHTIISLKLARRELGDNGAPSAHVLDEALEHAERANVQLRELVHGILPTVLRQGGLRAGVQALVSRVPLAVSVDVTRERLPPAVEATAYFIVAEALTNVIKHAGAGSAQIRAFVEQDSLHLEVRDDGAGGAIVDGGSGLLGLRDRAAALNGELRVESPPGGGTAITGTLPIPSS
jgi:signal transduction histidine kinase